MLLGVSAAVMVLLAGGWVVLNLIGGKKYRSFGKVHMEGLKLRKMSPPMLYLFDRFNIATRFPILFFRIQGSVQKIYGLRQSPEMTLLFMAESLAYGWLALLGGCLFTLISGEAMGLLSGLGLGILLPVLMVQDLHKKSFSVSRTS